MLTPRSTATWPSSGCSWPVIIRNSVVLPDPLGPTRPTFSPFRSAAEASMKRSWWPFCLLMLSRRIMDTWDLESATAPPLAHVAPTGKSGASRRVASCDTVAAPLAHVAPPRKGPLLQAETAPDQTDAGQKQQAEDHIPEISVAQGPVGPCAEPSAHERPR